MEKVIKRTNWLPVVMNAMVDAKAAHGPLTHDHSRALNILGEEVGESNAAYLNMSRPEPTGTKLELIGELAQVAATAINMITNLMEEQDGQ